METQFILATILGTLIGNGIAWAFPPIQWAKHKLRIDGDTYLELQEQFDNGDSLGFANGIRRYLAKALNCSPCCSWWSGLAVSVLYPQWWIAASAFCAFVLSAMIDKHYNQQ